MEENTKEELGQCFTTAFKAAEKLAAGGFIPHIVHGVVVGSEGCKIEGVEYIHGWVELQFGEKIICYDSETGVMVPMEEYYEAGKIKMAIKYFYPQAKLMAFEHGHFGPWNSVFVGRNEELIKKYYPKKQ